MTEDNAGDAPDVVVTDLEYTANFYDDQSPVRLNYIAALNGFAPRPIDRPFTYCELGCGLGLTTNLLAAAYPHGEFHGIDLNPAHIETARKDAAAGGIANVSFWERSFADLNDVALPAFDFITLHGVYAWVGADTRRTIRQLIKDRLKPGGIVYISYNALPGWAGLMPLRQIMLSFTANLGGSTLDKVRHGIAYLRFLRERQARYFVENPGAGEMLDTLLNQSAKYIAHEYFNANWHPMYLSEIATDMAEAGLAFAGSIPTFLNYRQMAVPGTYQEIFATAPDRIVFETHKDIVRNEKFRRDVFVKKDRPVLDEEAAVAFYEDLYFGVPDSGARFHDKVRVGYAEMELTERFLSDLFAACAAGAKTMAQLRRAPGLKHLDPRAIYDGVRLLVVTEQIFAFAGPPAPYPGPGAVLTLSPLNRIMVERSLTDPGVVGPTSRVAGTSYSPPLMDGLMLLARGSVLPERMAEWVTDYVASRDTNLQDAEGKPLEPEQQRIMLEQAAASFCAEKEPKYVELGILEPV